MIVIAFIGVWIWYRERRTLNWCIGADTLSPIRISLNTLTLFSKMNYTWTRKREVPYHEAKLEGKLGKEVEGREVG